MGAGFQLRGCYGCEGVGNRRRQRVQISKASKKSEDFASDQSAGEE